MKKTTVRNIIGAITLMFMLASCASVDGADKSVDTSRFGKKVKGTSGPGLHPAILTSHHSYSCGLEQTVMSRDANDGDKLGDDSVSVAAKGGAKVVFDITVSYRVNCEGDAVLNLYNSRIRTADQIRDKVVRPAVRSVMRDVVANVAPLDAATSARTKISADVSARLNEKMLAKPSNGGIIVDAVDIRNIYLPDNIQKEVDESIALQAKVNKVALQREAATAEAETQRLIAQQTAERKRIEASAAKEQAEIKAKSDASVAKIAADQAAAATREKGKAEADANREIAASLTPELADLKAKLAQAEALGKAGTVIVGGSSNASAPTIILDERK